MNAKTLVIASLATAAVVILPGVASANPMNEQAIAVDQIEWRIDRQLRRIQNGKVDGSLTRREFRKLMRANRRLNRKLDRALFDGFLSYGEEMRLTDMLENQSHRIRRLKNNRRFSRAHRFSHRGSRAHRRVMRTNRVAFRF